MIYVTNTPYNQTGITITIKILYLTIFRLFSRYCKSALFIVDELTSRVFMFNRCFKSALFIVDALTEGIYVV